VDFLVVQERARQPHLAVLGRDHIIGHARGIERRLDHARVQAADQVLLRAHALDLPDAQAQHQKDGRQREVGRTEGGLEAQYGSQVVSPSPDVERWWYCWATSTPLISRSGTRVATRMTGIQITACSHSGGS